MTKRTLVKPPVIPGYTYVRPLGSGGFADVFLFQQNTPRRYVAVKVLLSKITDSAASQALIAEADSMARLSAHPSIVTVYDASVSADGRPYIVMEYCPGAYVGRYRTEVIPLHEVLSLGVKISSAVESAHRAGMLHRDIKPANVLVSSFGQPVLTDFGVAVALHGPEDDTVAMSPPWSAPEIVDKRSAGTIASEVWGLAATVYTLLAGRSPFEIPGQKSDPEALKNRIRKAVYVPVGRADVPAELDSVFAKALSKDPQQRFGSAMEFGQALRNVEFQLNYPVTPLEVAGEGWGQPVAPDAHFAQPPVQGGLAASSPGLGPVRSTVAVDSKRRGPQNRPINAAAAPAKPKRTPLYIGIAAVVVAGVAAVLAIVSG